MTVRLAVLALLAIAGAIASVIASVIVGLAGSAALAAPISISAVASIAEMQGLNGTSARVVQVLSYYPGLNRGGGLFIWNAASGDAPDSCAVFAPQKQDAGQRGRWVRQLSGALDATMCGAYWDNSHDDAAALTRAFAAASRLHLALSLPGGTASICSSVKAAAGVVVRGQGMGPDATILDGNCMKSGWVFDINTPNGSNALEAPKYYDMQIWAAHNNNPGGCIRWNNAAGGFVDGTTSQYYMMHPHAERIGCNMGGDQQIGLECSKCFDGDFSQNDTAGGKHGVSLEGSDVMCIGCAGPNRFAYAVDSLVRMVSHGTFGNMDRVVGNEILYPTDKHQRYDSLIYDATRSSTIEGNHIEAIIPGVQSAIHVVGGFSHAIENNDVAVLTEIGVMGPKSAPHWLVTEGPFVNFRAFNNGCEGCILGPALFRNQSADFNAGGVRQVITHGGNAVNGDAGFP